MLLLIPDVFGAFSFYEMAHRFPESVPWTWLARHFTHAQWSGATVWDFVMPAFVFMVGVAMPYSYAARQREGRSHADIVAHAALRAVALFLLGLLFQLPPRNSLDSLWPFLILALGLPIPAWLSRVFDGSSAHRGRQTEWLWWGAILGACAVRIAVELPRAPGFSLHDILPQVGLGYLFVFLLVNRRRRTQWWFVAVVLIATWLAFLLYPLPAPGSDPRAFGLLPGEEVFRGYFAHWNKGSNFAAGFDRWFLNLQPRPTPFAFNSHGYQTLSFVPTLASMAFGLMVGEYLMSGQLRSTLRNGLFVAGALGIVGGLIAGMLLSPIVKSIWTPSWVLFSSGVVVVLFALLYHVIDVRGRRSWAFPLVVAGSNPLLLYTLAEHYRWWVLAPWRHSVGTSLTSLSWSPVLESMVCLVTLWLVAFVLYRYRLFVRL